jgi:hypothetical protein
MRYIHPVKDAAESFKKAAETIKRGAVLADRNRGDVWWSFDVTTECDIKNKWQELFDLQQKADMEVEEGHILTHASKNELTSDVAGLELAGGIGCTEDGTLTFREIDGLPKLKWSRSSTLYLYGCRTGLPIPKENNATMADAFFMGQDSVKTVIGERGKSYFSYKKEHYVRIDDNKSDTKDIYLLAFDRSENAQGGNINRLIGNITGNFKAISPYIKRRAL